MVVDDLKAKTLVPILKENIAKEATVYTDEAGQYRYLDRDFADHAFVRHGQGEWGRGPIHTNTIGSTCTATRRSSSSATTTGSPMVWTMECVLRSHCKVPRASG